MVISPKEDRMHPFSTYEAGFSNLSHFASIFEKHTGLKPKKFSSA